MRAMNRLLGTLVTAAGLLSTAEAAARLSAEEQLPDLPNKADLLLDFTLYADSDPAVKVIYYVPTHSGIAIDSPASASPRPRLSTLSRVPTRGYFAGETLVYLGGSLSTNAARGPLMRLEASARSLGYTIAPAPVEKVQTELITTAYTVKADADGALRVEVQCHQKEVGKFTSGKPIMVDECTVKNDASGAPYDIGTEVMYNFTALPYHGSTLGGRIPFQAITVPGWDQQINTLLSEGMGWDSILTGKVTWSVQAVRRTHKAVLDIHWKSLFEQASAFFALHAFSCIDVEVETFFQRIATCEGDAEKCGVSIVWYDASGRVTERPSDEAAFVDAVNELKGSLEKELFVQVQPDKSILGRVRKDTSAFFTLRANYEKRIVERNERREFYWNPGEKTLTAETALTIDCVKGGLDQRLSWDMEDAGCRAALGLETEP